MAKLSQAELVSIADGGFILRGPLTFDTVPVLWRDSARLLAGGRHGGATVNLAGVARADSAGLALLVAWQAQAAVAGQRLAYEAIPERLLAIARISEVDGLLSQA